MPSALKLKVVCNGTQRFLTTADSLIALQTIVATRLKCRPDDVRVQVRDEGELWEIDADGWHAFLSDGATVHVTAVAEDHDRAEPVAAVAAASASGGVPTGPRIDDRDATPIPISPSSVAKRSAPHDLDKAPSHENKRPRSSGRHQAQSTVPPSSAPGASASRPDPSAPSGTNGRPWDSQLAEARARAAATMRKQRRNTTSGVDQGENQAVTPVTPRTSHPELHSTTPATATAATPSLTRTALEEQQRGQHQLQPQHHLLPNDFPQKSSYKKWTPAEHRSLLSRFQERLQSLRAEQIPTSPEGRLDFFEAILRAYPARFKGRSATALEQRVSTVVLKAMRRGDQLSPELLSMYPKRRPPPTTPRAMRSASGSRSTRSAASSPERGRATSGSARGEAAARSQASRSRSGWEPITVLDSDDEDIDYEGSEADDSSSSSSDGVSEVNDLGTPAGTPPPPASATGGALFAEDREARARETMARQSAQNPFAASDAGWLASAPPPKERKVERLEPPLRDPVRPASAKPALRVRLPSGKPMSKDANPWEHKSCRPGLQGLQNLLSKVQLDNVGHMYFKLIGAMRTMPRQRILDEDPDLFPNCIDEILSQVFARLNSSLSYRRAAFLAARLLLDWCGAFYTPREADDLRRPEARHTHGLMEHALGLALDRFLDARNCSLAEAPVEKWPAMDVAAALLVSRGSWGCTYNFVRHVLKPPYHPHALERLLDRFVLLGNHLKKHDEERVFWPRYQTLRDAVETAMHHALGEEACEGDASLAHPRSPLDQVRRIADALSERRAVDGDEEHACFVLEYRSFASGQPRSDAIRDAFRDLSVHLPGCDPRLVCDGADVAMGAAGGGGDVSVGKDTKTTNWHNEWTLRFGEADGPDGMTTREVEAVLAPLLPAGDWNVRAHLVGADEGAGTRLMRWDEFRAVRAAAIDVAASAAVVATTASKASSTASRTAATRRPPPPLPRRPPMPMFEPVHDERRPSNKERKRAKRAEYLRQRALFRARADPHAAAGAKAQARSRGRTPTSPKACRAPLPKAQRDPRNGRERRSPHKVEAKHEVRDEGEKRRVDEGTRGGWRRDQAGEEEQRRAYQERRGGRNLAAATDGRRDVPPHVLQAQVRNNGGGGGSAVEHIDALLSSLGGARYEAPRPATGDEVPRPPSPPPPPPCQRDEQGHVAAQTPPKPQLARASAPPERSRATSVEEGEIAAGTPRRRASADDGGKSPPSPPTPSPPRTPQAELPQQQPPSPLRPCKPSAEEREQAHGPRGSMLAVLGGESTTVETTRSTAHSSPPPPPPSPLFSISSSSSSSLSSGQPPSTPPPPPPACEKEGRTRYEDEGQGEVQPA